MTIGELNNKLTQALKNYIKSSGHNDTGTLYNSIRFLCTDSKDGGNLKIKFKTMDYIQYLDNGEMVNKFLSLDSTLDIITEYLSTTLIFTQEQNLS